MSRSNRAQIAQETVAIVQRGWYEGPGGQRVDISPLMSRCLEQTKLFTPKAVEPLVQRLPQRSAAHATLFEVVNETTLAAARRLIVERGHPRVLALNFASAKNPGGGFLGGSQAQEESLARSSGLYASLLTQDAYYEANRACRTCLYTDHMILSPGVPVFRDDEGNLLAQPHCLGMLTAPAVNAGAIRKNEPHNAGKISGVLASRLSKLLAVAVHEGYEHLVLGAWGCGVFRNDPAELAALFAAALRRGGPFQNQFQAVVFAVLDSTPGQTTIGPFREQFGEAHA